ncbi:MAG TPA: protocatechuate 3,4-dioxygenase subunit alpha [Bryobacteraceae bacterium]|nr:protocatechuate 3,4-dioxygenase subunit alpha [Bryobacteraceae bacterium]
MKPLPSQTVGPFYHLALTANAALGCLTHPDAKGESIWVRFRLLDGDGVPVPDGMIEIWQADAFGNYDQPPDSPFRGFGRLPTDSDGACTFETIPPGRTADNQAPHLNVSVFARGLLARLCTRVYFELADDPVLALVPEERRHTLLAHRDSAQPFQWNFDIRLQGENETVFFDI